MICLFNRNIEYPPKNLLRSRFYESAALRWLRTRKCILHTHILQVPARKTTTLEGQGMCFVQNFSIVP